MKLFNILSRSMFDVFSKSNMDPALHLLGINLTAYEKRKQVAARLLGYNAFEAITFSDTSDASTHKPRGHEMVVGMSPEIPHLLIIVMQQHSFYVSGTSGEYFIIKGAGLNFKTALFSAALHYESGRSKLVESCGYFETNFEPSLFETTWSGPQIFSYINRTSPQKIQIDWVMRNGLLQTVIVEHSVSFTDKKPTPNECELSSQLTLRVESSHFTTEDANEYRSPQVVFTKETTGQHKHITDEMCLWYLHQEENLKLIYYNWRRASRVVMESFDCIRIAYEFIDAQRASGKKRKFSSIKNHVEKWAGRYISAADFDIAIQFHPEFHGENGFYNIELPLVMPDLNRLREIREAFSHKYEFDPSLLNQFELMEQNGKNIPFDSEAFLTQRAALNSKK